MKAILKFDLNDEDDIMAHFRCVKSMDMALAMWSFTAKLRQLVDASEDGKWIDEQLVWQAWEEAMEYNGIKMDELIR